MKNKNKNETQNNMLGCDCEGTQVLICGCGPTGALLAGYLCQMGVTSIVLEKDSNITVDPRGIALDDEGIRILQGLGLYKHVFTEIGACVDQVNFIGGTNNDLNRQPFLTFDMVSVRYSTLDISIRVK